MKMTKKKVKELRDEALAQLKDWADERGVSVTYIGGNFTDTSAVLKFEFALVDTEGKVLSRTAEDWKLYAPLHDLPEDGIGMTFLMSHLGEVEIIGWKVANKKYPVIIKSLLNGRSYKLTVEQAKFSLAMSALNREQPK